MTNSLNSKSVRNKKSSKPKSSAHYQRQYRKRLRDQGLVKKEVWILPQNHPVLLTVEKALRQHYADSVNQLKKLNNEAKRLLQNGGTELVEQTTGENKMHKSKQVVDNINNSSMNVTGQYPALVNIHWTTETLYQNLRRAGLFVDGNASIELIEGLAPTMHIIMHEYGDLPIFINVSGEQVLVEALLFGVEEINDRATFNELILRTHKYFPLSTICLEKHEEGEYYQMFGALSSTASLQDVIIEIELLANNVIQATESYSEFFGSDKIAS